MSTASGVGVVAPWIADPQPASVLSLWADLERRGIAIVTTQGSVTWTNVAARKILAEHPDFRMGGGALLFSDALQRESFGSFILAATEHLSSWCHRGSQGSEGLLFSARSLASGEDNLVGLIFHGTGSSYTMAWADFRGVFNLTPSEHRAVLRLLDGDTAEAAAVSLEISVETVRTHIRRAYVKIGVGSREQLFRVLAPFRH